MVEAKGLTKVYGTRFALRGVDLSAKGGEIHGIFGPNGAGKSTLVRILSGQARPTTGSVRICEHDMRRESDAARGCLGVIGHQTYLYDDLTAEENLRFYSRMYNLSLSRAQLQVSLDSVGLSGRGGEPVRYYSRGMQQRLALARATFHKPKVLILDEPYTGLDRDASRFLDNLLRDLAAQGKCVLLVTHDVEHGLELSDTVMVLASGRVVAQAEAAQFSSDAIAESYTRAGTGGNP